MKRRAAAVTLLACRLELHSQRRARQIHHHHQVSTTAVEPVYTISYTFKTPACVSASVVYGDPSGGLDSVNERPPVASCVTISNALHPATAFWIVNAQVAFNVPET